MQLSKYEQRMLSGEFGQGTAWAMDLLVKLGDQFDAERMVEVGSAHILGDIIVCREPGIKFIKELADGGAKFKVPTSIDSAGTDFDDWEELGIDKITFDKQMALTQSLIKMGVLPWYSDTSFLVGLLPRFGEHVAWTDSVMVVFANSVMGARTNLEGYYSSIAGAITGRVPEMGLHLTQNRRGTALVELKTELNDSSDWDALGYYVSMQLKRPDAVPVFLNLPNYASIDQLKRLRTLMCPFSIWMFHAIGITPEAQTLEQALGGTKPAHKLVVESRHLQEVYDRWTGSGKVDMVWFGSPHLSLPEIQQITRAFPVEKAHKDVEVWLFTVEAFKNMAKRMGLAAVLGKAGGKIYSAMQGMLMPGEQAAQRLRGKTIVTDNATICHWGVSMMQAMSKTEIPVKLILKSREDCIKAAITGKV